MFLLQLGKEKNSKHQFMQVQCQKARKDIILACAYPRLDVEVSKKMNHLLKAPFCVHPKTGKASLVCPCLTNILASCVYHYITAL